MLKIKELNFKYKKSEDGVFDVNLEFLKPKVVGVIGDNGSGKSTLFKLISGYINPPKETVFVKEKEFTENTLYCKEHLSICFDKPSLLEKLTVLENLNYFNIFFKQSKERINEIVEDLDLNKHLNYPVKKLSFGFKQRVNIASLLLRNSDILILDEPYNGLDVSSIKSLNNVIRKYKNEKLILISGHFIDEIQENTDHIILFSKGKIVFNNVNPYVKDLSYVLYKCDNNQPNKEFLNIQCVPYFEKEGKLHFFIDSKEIDIADKIQNIELIKEVTRIKDIYNLL